MKKLFAIIFIFFLSITSSFAFTLFVEGQGEYINTATKHYPSLSGFGAGLGVGLTDNVNLIARFAQASESHKLYSYFDVNTDCKFMTGGIEIIPSISSLDKIRTYWKSSLEFGRSEFNYENNYPTNTHAEGRGYVVLFKTGLQYNFTQIVSPYFNIGYHKSSYPDSTDIKISGWEADFGVRIYVFGIKDYDAGY